MEIALLKHYYYVRAEPQIRFGLEKNELISVFIGYSMQANRIGYKRRWIAARRTLSKSACSSTPIPNLDELQIEPNDADQSIAGLELEQSDTEHFELLEPSPKRLNVSESCANDQLHLSQENYYSSSSDSDDLDETLKS